jgi:signal transduction histidine kinase
MPLNVLLCDTADELARLQYHFLRAGADIAAEVTTDAFRAVEMAARTRPDVIVCELGLEGLGGLELVKRLRASSPDSKLLVWAVDRDPATVADVLTAGAAGYLAKDDSPDELLAAIRTAAQGSVAFSASVAGRLGEELARALARAGELESELVRVKDSVAQGTSAKADFLANISHELRTPVTVAKGIAYVLRNPSVPEHERAEFLSQLQASLDRLMSIVDEIITIAELERGTFELNLAEVDLAPLLRHAVDETTLAYPDVPIETSVGDALYAIADGARIGGVVRELLDNACRYSPIGRPVEITARALDEGVVVTITDRGEGLDRAVASQSFDEPFSTGEETLRKEKAGAGVGLHLARQMVLEHGGILWADPLPGGGTRAAFCIPSHAGHRFAVPPANAATEEGAGHATSPRASESVVRPHPAA